MKNLKEKIKDIPECPGCYIWKNKDGEILYIGKSKSLRKRVSQYIRRPEQKEGKLAILAQRVTDVEYITTPTETDALLLECQLIKTHLPPFNSQLKHDRSYPFIRIDVKSEYPAISVAHEKYNDDALYFGCFYGSQDALNSIKVINKIWYTPLCNKQTFQKKSRTCLLYHLGKCCGPCERKITIESYKDILNEVIAFLSGKSRKAKMNLKTAMAEAATEMEFEKAAILRNTLTELEELERKVRRLNTLFTNRDVYLFLRAFNEDGFSLFLIRDGITLHRMTSSNLNLDLVQLNQFLIQIEDQEFNLHKQEKLTTHLMDIFADKYFINIKKGSKGPGLLRRLQKEYQHFLNR